MLSMRKPRVPSSGQMLKSYSGCEPLTPDDIAEVVVFTAGRQENVIVADTLVFPNHQVSRPARSLTVQPYQDFRSPWASHTVH